MPRSVTQIDDDVLRIDAGHRKAGRGGTFYKCTILHIAILSRLTLTEGYKINPYNRGIALAMYKTHSGL